MSQVWVELAHELAFVVTQPIKHLVGIDSTSEAALVERERQLPI